ncbi:MAG: MFS transporter [Gammaproteobacteria bacterium]|nr:MFS transporter [Gammaproteobacteria bacterium]MDP6617313.1 MFS transporter [Gammaproteobacteria bacterium]MDP6694091.1 MFS transporter [Gammaproteobacteria bacterium]
MKLGPIRMVPGVRPINVVTLFFASFFGIAVMSFMNAQAPILFREILGIAQDEVGRLSSTLVVSHEIVVILCIAPIGAMSDKFGRRPFYALAFLLLAIGHFLYPLANSESELLMYRLVFAVGAASATAMLAAVANDYPEESGRGRMIAVTMFFNGLGLFLLFMFLFRPLQGWFENAGFTTPEAVTYVRWVVAGLCVIVAVAAAGGLKKGAPAQVAQREPLLTTLKVGLKAAKQPRIALAYFAALVSRGDLAVVSTFFTLWLFTIGVEQGLDESYAQGRAFLFYATIQGAALLGAIVAGILFDYFDRLLCLAAAMVIGACGYGSLVFLPNPLESNLMWGSAILVGFAEISANLASLSLVGSEAPVKGRGSVIGMFSLFGAVGIMAVAWAGGQLFDLWRPTGPFALVAIANVVVLVVALLLYFAQRNARAAEVA